VRNELKFKKLFELFWCSQKGSFSIQAVRFLKFIPSVRDGLKKRRSMNWKDAFLAQQE